MKHWRTLRVCAVSCALLGLWQTSASAGPLDPPVGPVAPSYKTLDQVRPGTPIDTIPYLITQPGTYFLTGNFSHAGPGSAIIVEAPDVTIDLGGFSLTGPGPDSGINGVETITTGANLRLHNGTINSFDTGVIGVGRNAQIIGVRVSGNGYGISAAASLISGCTAVENTHVGITTQLAQYTIPGYGSAASSSAAVVEHCSAIANGEAGYVIAEGALLVDSSASINKRFGINTTGACRIQRCNVSGTVADGSTPGYGVALASGANITDTTVRGCATGGIFLASSRNVVKGCNVSNNGQFGIGGLDSNGQIANGFYAEISDCHVAGHTASPGYGIAVTSDCSITNNVVMNNLYAGIIVQGGGNRIIGNQGRGNGATGGSFNFSGQIVIFGDRNHIESNACNNGPWNGIFVLTTRNVVIRNVCGGNPNVNYFIASGNNAGPIIDRVAAGSNITTSDPSANISY